MPERAQSSAHLHEGEPNGRCASGEQKGLGEQLRDDPSSTGTKGGTHRNLAHAGRRPGVDQDGDVDADDDKKQAGEDGHGPEAVRAASAHAGELIGIGHDLGPQILVSVRECGSHARSDDGQFGVRAGELETCREPSGDEDRWTVAPLVSDGSAVDGVQ